jgi:hypothetical protein
MQAKAGGYGEQHGVRYVLSDTEAVLDSDTDADSDGVLVEEGVRDVEAEGEAEGVEDGVGVALAHTVLGDATAGSTNTSGAQREEGQGWGGGRGWTSHRQDAATCSRHAASCIPVLC